VVFLVVADTLQRYFYDMVVDRLAWRVLLVSPILAAVLVRWPLSFEDVFMKPGPTLLQVLLWFVACWLALRFQWGHAAVLAVVSVALAVPIASFTIESLFGRGPGTAAAPPAVAKKQRAVPKRPAAKKAAAGTKPATASGRRSVPGAKPGVRQPAGFPRQPAGFRRQPAGYPRQPATGRTQPAGFPRRPAGQQQAPTRIPGQRRQPYRPPGGTRR